MWHLEIFHAIGFQIGKKKRNTTMSEIYFSFQKIPFVLKFS